jgi:hypothetical protein
MNYNLLNHFEQKLGYEFQAVILDLHVGYFIIFMHGIARLKVLEAHL